MTLAEYDTTRYTPAAREVLRLADDEARDLRQTELGTHHFLIALVRVGAFPGDVREARLAVREATFELQPRVESKDQLPPSLPLSFGSRQFLQRAETIAGDSPVDVVHLAESMKKQSGHVVSVLHRMGIFLY
ncbi:MAG: hypothetical protein NZ518_02545 [Dehalococcoidia bacterium]|nr:hypothetical protein [Dehalococcoidia bacterium]